MGFIIGLLTVIMVVDCLVLIFLVLIQLPKKDAGSGLAFGATATDALFGAGSGTVLTKITKYAAGAFFIMAVLLSLLHSSYQRSTSNAFAGQLGKNPAAVVPASAPATASASNTISSIPATNLVVPPAPENTNLPAATNAPVASPSNPPASTPKPQ